MSGRRQPQPGDAEQLPGLVEKYRSLGFSQIFYRATSKRPMEFSAPEWDLIMRNLKEFRRLAGMETRVLQLDIPRVPFLGVLIAHLTPTMVDYGWSVTSKNQCVEFALRLLAVHEGLLPESELQYKSRKNTSRVTRTIRRWAK